MSKAYIGGYKIAKGDHLISREYGKCSVVECSQIGYDNYYIVVSNAQGRWQLSDREVEQSVFDWSKYRE